MDRFWRLAVLVAIGLLFPSLSSGLGADDAAGAPSSSATFRFVFFGPAGPLVLNARVDMGNYSVAESRRTYADELFVRLDANQSGRLEPEEWAGVPLIGNPQVQIEQFAEEGSLSQEGLRRLIDARLGPAFVVTTKSRLDQSVRLVDLLDQDGDGVVSLHEALQAHTAMRAFDFDDDDALSVAELQPFPASIRAARQQQQASDPRQALVIHLETPADVAAAVARIRATYSPDSPVVELDRCGLRKSATQFDANGDGALDESELQAWLASSQSDVELQVQLAERQLTRVIATAARSLRVQPAPDASPRHWHVLLDGVPLQVDAANNRYMTRDFVSLTKTRFRISDRDKNGYISEDEFGGLQLAVPFAAVDLNGDGMLLESELDAYARQLGQLSQAQLVLTVADDTTSLFQLMDSDSNNRLTTRELMTLEERLAMADRNGNGLMDSGDFLNKHRMSFSFGVPAGFGNLPPAMSTMTMSSRRPAGPRVGPLWFQRMDRNLDQDVSWREFLGPRSTFDALDLNGDGLIDKDEAEAATPSDDDA
ncbi:MAG: EF-hand domain-containing protein [Planctomyces sp.]|nr:EF-hand domain-containing protein [Planctomyces sp.]